MSNRIVAGGAARRAVLILTFLIGATTARADLADDLLRMGIGVILNGQQQGITSPGTTTNSTQNSTQTRTPKQNTASSEVAQIQSLLNGLGYNAGSVDGEMGRKTREAIVRFETDMGLPVTGQPSPMVLQALLQTAPGSTGQALNTPIVAVQQSSDFTLLNGFDLPFGDYRSGLTDPRLRGISLDGCAAACRDEGTCVAFTFNQKAAVCILKSTQTAPSPFAGAISGIKIDTAATGGGSSQAGIIDPATANSGAPAFDQAKAAGYADFVHLAIKPFMDDYRNSIDASALDYRFAVAGPEACAAYSTEWTTVSSRPFEFETYIQRATAEFETTLASIAGTPDTVEAILREERTLAPYDFAKGGFPITSGLFSPMESTVDLATRDSSPPCANFWGSSVTAALSSIGRPATDTGLRHLRATLVPLVKESFIPLSKERALTLVQDKPNPLVTVEALVTLSAPARPFGPLFGKVRAIRIMDQKTGEVIHEIAAGSAPPADPAAPPTLRDFLLLAMKSDLEGFMAQPEYFGAYFDALTSDKRTCEEHARIMSGHDEFAIRDYLRDAGTRFKALGGEVAAARSTLYWETEISSWLDNYDFGRGGFPIGMAASGGRGPFIEPVDIALFDQRKLPGACAMSMYDTDRWVQQLIGGDTMQWTGQGWQVSVKTAGIDFGAFLPMDEARAREISAQGVSQVTVRARVRVDARPQGRGPLPGTIESVTFINPQTKEVLGTASAPVAEDTGNSPAPSGGVPELTAEILADIIAPVALSQKTDAELTQALTGYFAQRAPSIAAGNLPPGVPLALSDVRNVDPAVVVSQHRDALVAAITERKTQLPASFRVTRRVPAYHHPDRSKLAMSFNAVRGELSADGAVLTGGYGGLLQLNRNDAYAGEADLKTAVMSGFIDGVPMRTDREVIFDEIDISPEDAAQRGLTRTQGRIPDQIDVTVEIDVLAVGMHERGGPEVVTSIRRATASWASDGKIIVDQDFAGVPTAAEQAALDAPKSAAELPVASPPDGQVLSAEMVDLLQLRFAPDTVDDGQLRRMFLARLAYESALAQQGQEPVWGRFFPDPQAVIDAGTVDGLLPMFRTWSAARAAALPETFVLPVALHNGVPAFRNWGEFSQTGNQLRCNSVNQGSEGTERAVKGQRLCDFLAAAWPLPDAHIYLRDSSFNDSAQSGAGAGPRAACGTELYCRSIQQAKQTAGIAVIDRFNRVVPHHDLFKVSALPVIDGAALAGQSELEVRLAVRITGATRLAAWPDTTWTAALRAAEPFSQASGMGLPIPAPVDLPPGAFEFTTEVIGAEVVHGPSGEVIARPELAALMPLPLEALDMPEAKATAAWDVLGLKIGMGLDEAEAIVRAHMEVGAVLTADRRKLTSTATGRPPPYSSGRLFASADQSELIALIDEPPAAEGTVVAMWRMLRLPAADIDALSLRARLVRKYGEPASEVAGTHEGEVIFTWSEFAPEGDCGKAQDSHQSEYWQLPAETGNLTDLVKKRYFPGPSSYPMQMWAESGQLEMSVPRLCPPSLSVRFRKDAVGAAPGTLSEIVFLISDERAYGALYLESLNTGFSGDATDSGTGSTTEIEF